MLDKWRTSKLKVGYKSTVKYHIVLESKTNGIEINRYSYFKGNMFNILGKNTKVSFYAGENLVARSNSL